MKQFICMMSILLTCFGGTGVLLGLTERNEQFTIIGICSLVGAYAFYEILLKMTKER